MTIKITLHRFESDPNLKQRDGVNLAHTEINRLLEEETPEGLAVSFHDFDRLLRDDDYARETLQDADAVLCNVGPHGHYYFYLRARLGLHFRIVRDIKTALWSSYLLQETLCQPYLRPGDSLLATSNYSRVLTRRLFPHLQDHPIHLFEPVLASRQDHLTTSCKTPDGNAVINLGYIGRLSEDKNFSQVVDLLVELHNKEPGRYRLTACGAVHSPSCAPNLVTQRLLDETGRADLFHYLPPVPHSEVLPLLRNFDYFLFFSTSNLEVLGRVLIEAAYAGVPVLASHHAAAPELVTPASLIDVTYRENNALYTHFDAPMGTIDIQQAAELIRGRQRPPLPEEIGVNNANTLAEVLLNQVLNPDPAVEHRLLSQRKQDFIAKLRWQNLPRIESIAIADRKIAELRTWFCALNGKRTPTLATYLHELEQRSKFKDRTRRFIASLEATRGDFTNLGGIDIELCNILNFHPRFHLVSAAQQQFVAPKEAQRA